jgi:P-type conjugative transfer protein TrbG
MLRSTTLATTLAIVLALASTLPGHGSEVPVPDQIGAWTILPYGASNPVLNCMPLGACLVALEDGEAVQSRFLPDSARWQVEPGTTGPGERTPVLAIKPKECGISTNLFVTTDRRIYTFLLNSPACEPSQLSASTIKFDQVRFSYPEAFLKIWQESAPQPAAGIALSAVRVNDLNFDYTWSAGRRAVEPRVVYDDGSRTYIVLKEEDRGREAPAVFVHGDHGKLEAVNFIPPAAGATTYTVDRVGAELVLVSGASSNQRTLIRSRKVR